MRIRLPSVLWPYLDAAEFLWFRIAGGLPSQLLRRAMFSMAGGHLGADSVLYGGSEIRCARKVTIGEGTSIGHECKLDGRGGLTIGNSVNLSTGVWVWTAEHDVQSSSFAATSAPTVIEDYAWLAGRVIVMPGITIGRGAVVASGAVVTRDVPANTIVAGVPAKAIGVRKCELNYRLGSAVPLI